MAAIAKYPKRNVHLRLGARVIKQNIGEPTLPEPLPDIRVPDREVRIIRGLRGWISGRAAPPIPVLQSVLDMLRDARAQIEVAEKGITDFLIPAPPL